MGTKGISVGAEGFLRGSISSSLLSVYKSYDELPLFLNSDLVAKTLGIAPSSAYELMHEKNFPTLRIGSRMVVPKEKFIQWVEEHTKGGERA
jgi:predicted DNA-binding transcriptional regulator AlpA